MKRSALILSLLACLSGTTMAETLLVDRVKQPESNRPMRGWNAARVQAKYGAPQQRLDPRGGQKRQWPSINRWVYPEFTVYFEKGRVIDVVANKASAGELGPKPPVR